MSSERGGKQACVDCRESDRPQDCCPHPISYAPPFTDAVVGRQEVQS